MYDQIAMASLIDLSLVKSARLYVDVNIDHGIGYGVFVGGREIGSGAEGAQQMNVQHDLDWPRFIEIFFERVQKSVEQELTAVQTTGDRRGRQETT